MFSVRGTSVRRLIGVVGIGLAAGLAVAGCGTPSVPSSDVAAKVSEQLKMQGLEAEAVSCQGDLPAEVGRTVRCTVKVLNDDRDGTAKVTAVDGRTATIDFTLDDFGLDGSPPPSSPPT